MRRLGLIAVSSTLVAIPVFAQPVVTFDGDTIAAKGITPGGSAVVVVAAHQRGDWLDHVIHFQVALDDNDGDGVVTFTRKQGIPTRAVTIVVDLATGALGWGSPPEFRHPGPRPLPSTALDYVPGAALVQIAETAPGLDVVLVKRGEGAWATSLFDGGPLDADAAEDGVVTVAFAALMPIGRTAHAADAARAGDVLVLLDPMTLEYAAARLAAGKS